MCTLWMCFVVDVGAANPMCCNLAMGSLLDECEQRLQKLHSDACLQAKKNASEARAWIQNWRDNGVTWAEEAAEEVAEQTSGIFSGTQQTPRSKRAYQLSAETDHY
jgi:hypothetical protein